MYLGGPHSASKVSRSFLLPLLSTGSQRDPMKLRITPSHSAHNSPRPPLPPRSPGPSDTSKPQAGSEGEGLWLRLPGHSASPLGSRGDLTTCRNALCSPKRNLCRAGKMQGGAVCGVKTREDSMLKSREGFGNCLPDVLNQQNSKLQKTKRAHA